jgi:Zn-dependent protease with chaperone function
VETVDPTSRISLDFTGWVARRQHQEARHMVNGTPDYAFSMDALLHRKLARIAPLRAVAQAILTAAVPIQRALHTTKGVAVGPRQLPEIHRMGVACAERLGIAVPQIFVVQDPQPNAFTLAAGQVDQIIVLHSSLVEMLGPRELQFVIGHECGHIHNEHSVFNTAWELMTNTIGRTILAQLGWVGRLLATVAAAPLWWMMGRWRRCAELTCDRAGLICAGDLDACQRALASLSMGRIAASDTFDVAEYEKQARANAQNPLRFAELALGHPPVPKRVAALAEFARTDVWSSWRPELAPTPTVPISVVDDIVAKMLV